MTQLESCQGKLCPFWDYEAAPRIVLGMKGKTMNMRLAFSTWPRHWHTGRFVNTWHWADQKGSSMGIVTQALSVNKLCPYGCSMTLILLPLHSEAESFWKKIKKWTDRQWQKKVFCRVWHWCLISWLMGEPIARFQGSEQAALAQPQIFHFSITVFFFSGISDHSGTQYVIAKFVVSDS